MLLKFNTLVQVTMWCTLIVLSTPSAGAVTLVTAKQATVAPFALMTLKTNTAPPGSVLVHFSDGQHFSADMPAFSISPNSIAVVVPPYFNATSGHYGSGNVMISLRNEGQPISNTIGPLQIEDLPPTNMPPGTFLANAFEAASQGRKQVREKLRFAELATQGKFNAGQARSQLWTSANDNRVLASRLRGLAVPGAAPVAVGTVNGSALMLDAAAAHEADRVILAYIRQFKSWLTASATTAHPLSIEAKAAEAEDVSISDCLLNNLSLFASTDTEGGADAFSLAQDCASLGPRILASTMAGLYQVGKNTYWAGVGLTVLLAPTPAAPAASVTAELALSGLALSTIADATAAYLYRNGAANDPEVAAALDQIRNDPSSYKLLTGELTSMFNTASNWLSADPAVQDEVNSLVTDVEVLPGISDQLSQNPVAGADPTTLSGQVDVGSQAPNGQGDVYLHLSGDDPNLDDLSGSLYNVFYQIQVPSDQIGQTIPAQEELTVVAPDAGQNATPVNLRRGSQQANLSSPQVATSTLTGSMSASGTANCGSSTDTFSASGSLALTINPALATLVQSGGSFSGTWTLQFAGSGCSQIIFQTLSGSLSGSMMNGTVNVTFVTSDGTCSFSGAGTADSLTGQASAACVSSALDGGISFSASNNGAATFSVSGS